MKAAAVLLGLIVLVGLVAATPAVYRVAVTPLYGNIENTLTCRYISNDSAATADFRWYDGHDGVYYDGNETYSDLVAGYEYNCSVNLTRGSTHTGWYNSTNAAQISDTCLDPMPLYFANNEANYNISSIYNAGLSFYVVGNYHKRVMENNSFLFVGSEFGNDKPICDNTLYLLTGSGDYSLASNTTDQSWTTRNSHSTTSTSYQYSTYDPIGVIPAGTLIRSKVGLKCTASERSYFVLQGKTINNTWVNLTTRNVLGTTEIRYIDNSTTTSNYYALRVGHKTSAVTDTAWLYVYDIDIINATCGTVTGSAVSATWDVNDFDNFTSVGGDLINLSWINEETGADFSLTSTGIQDDILIKVGCEVGDTEINVTDLTSGKSIAVGTTEDNRHIETYINYNDTSNYYRRLSPVCSSDIYAEWDMIMADAATADVSAYTITLSETGGTSYGDGWVSFKKIVPGIGSTAVIREQWPADNSVLAYLIDHTEYSVTLTASDCSERALGWVTANPSNPAMTLTVAGIDFNTTQYVDMFDTVRFDFDYDIDDGRVNLTYEDTANETTWLWWGVYYFNNGTLFYEDNTTSNSYHGSALVNTSYEYYARIVAQHADGKINHTEGMLERTGDFFDDLNYTGEVLGLHYETLYLLVALLVLATSALVIMPSSVGIGALALWGEGVFFSVIGWLPLFEYGNATGWFITVLTLILAGAMAYYEKR